MKNEVFDQATRADMRRIDRASRRQDRIASDAAKEDTWWPAARLGAQKTRFSAWTGGPRRAQEQTSPTQGQREVL